MNTRQFQYALTLAKLCNFSRAAQELGISQPSLSQYIQKLENEVGAMLFIREGAFIRLTDAGQVYIDTGRAVLDMEKQMQSRMDDIAENRAGTLTLGISPYRSVCVMPRVLSAFAALYPGVSVTLCERVGDDLIDGAAHGEFDLCITALPVNEKMFASEIIMREEMVVAVPRGHALSETLRAGARAADNRAFPAIDISLINGAPFVMLSTHQRMQRILREICRQHDLTLRKTVECVNIDTLKVMCEAGLGMGIIPSSTIAPDEERGALQYYSIMQDTPTRDIVVIYRHGQYLSRPMRDMIGLLKQSFLHI